MSRNKHYQHLLNSKRWKQLRQQYLQAHPLCERCLREGFNAAAVDLHHKVPVESALTQAEMEQLCFDKGNLEALCIPCHKKTHQEMGQATKQNHIDRSNSALQRWIARHTKNNGDQSTAPTETMK